MSSDPKPREGTETRETAPSLAGAAYVIRPPKTPRGDGNWIALTGLALILDVIRPPKTPRGDGNFSDHLCGISGLMSSDDPKPREGTET
ncbi:Uncharacterised protein [Mycobacterium tuberculosis]|nr:Uncharacterised protein [Mycobacterium tuberculosis]